VDHVKICYKKNKKTLKIAEISDNIITRKKKFEYLRRGFKLQIMKAQDEGIKQKFNSIGLEEIDKHQARMKRMTIHGAFTLSCFSTNVGSSKKSSKEINEMKADYH
jgi:sulfite reductase beta subunit-like hemoprotein